MHSEHHAPSDEHEGSGSARTTQTLNQIDALDTIARRQGQPLAIDREELLELLNTATAGGGK